MLERLRDQRGFGVSLLKGHEPPVISRHPANLDVCGGNGPAADWKGCCIRGRIFCPLNLLRQGEPKSSRRREFVRRALVAKGSAVHVSDIMRQCERLYEREGYCVNRFGFSLDSSVNGLH